MKAKIVLAVLLVSGLYGCVGVIENIDWNDPQSISARIASKHDDFKKHTVYEGPDYAQAGHDKASLRAWRTDKTERVEYQIYMMDYFQMEGGPPRYNTAWDSNGNEMPVVMSSIERLQCTRLGCTYYQHVGIDVSRDYLVTNQTAGVRLKLGWTAGRRGMPGAVNMLVKDEPIFYIPPAYVKAMLAATK
jgi:hypothetical protein